MKYGIAALAFCLLTCLYLVIQVSADDASSTDGLPVLDKCFVIQSVIQGIDVRSLAEVAPWVHPPSDKRTKEPVSADPNVRIVAKLVQSRQVEERATIKIYDVNGVEHESRILPGGIRPWTAITVDTNGALVIALSPDDGRTPSDSDGESEGLVALWDLNKGKASIRKLPVQYGSYASFAPTGNKLLFGHATMEQTSIEIRQLPDFEIRQAFTMKGLSHFVGWSHSEEPVFSKLENPNLVFYSTLNGTNCKELSRFRLDDLVDIHNFSPGPDGLTLISVSLAVPISKAAVGEISNLDQLAYDVRRNQLFKLIAEPMTDNALLLRLVPRQ
jgi:hypothetical protein